MQNTSIPHKCWGGSVTVPSLPLCLPSRFGLTNSEYLFIYLGYNTMVAGFTSNHTYMRRKTRKQAIRKQVKQ